MQATGLWAGAAHILDYSKGPEPASRGERGPSTRVSSQPAGAPFWHADSQSGYSTPVFPFSTIPSDSFGSWSGIRTLRPRGGYDLL